MTQHFEGWAYQVEFRVTVDAERAAEFAPALAELALEYDATVVSNRETRQDEPSQVESDEIFPFRNDLATEIVEDSSGEKVWIVTKSDLHSFAASRKFDGTLVSRAYNTVMRELTYQTCIQNPKAKAYIAKGSAVPVAWDQEGTTRTKVSGLRVDTIADLQTMLAESEHIHGYSTRSRDLMKEFVQVLFNPDEQ